MESVLLWVVSSSEDAIELICMRPFVLPVVFSESRQCVYFDETDFKHYFSEPVPAIRAYTGRPKYVNNAILVTIFPEVSRMKLVSHEKSIADVCRKMYSFLRFRQRCM